MIKKGIDLLNETYYYALIIKLSLNQQGKSWRECLQIEKIVSFYLYSGYFRKIKWGKKLLHSTKIISCEKHSVIGLKDIFNRLKKTKELVKFNHSNKVQWFQH